MSLQFVESFRSLREDAGVVIGVYFLLPLGIIFFCANLRMLDAMFCYAFSCNVLLCF